MIAKTFKFAVQVECASHSLQTTNRPLGACSGHVTHWQFWWLQSCHWNGWT